MQSTVVKFFIHQLDSKGIKESLERIRFGTLDVREV